MVQQILYQNNEIFQNHYARSMKYFRSVFMKKNNTFRKNLQNKMHIIYLYNPLVSNSPEKEIFLKIFFI